MQEIEEIAKEYCIHMFGEVRGDILAAMVKAAKWARDQQPNWISVNDSLPEKGINVLCMRNSHMIVARLTKEYDRPDWYALNNWIHGVTHWMPLPEGPSNSPNPTTRNE